MTRAISLALLFLLGGPASGQEDPQSLRYTPASQTFACDLPGADWHAFEEEEESGFAVHILGPDNPSGTYRAGIDIRWIEKGQQGWIPLKKRVDVLRRPDNDTSRGATVVRPYRLPAGLSRVFEVVETRRLPADQLPSIDEELHHYYAMLPVGESYYELKLSTSRDSYYEYRQLFAKFLRNFKPIGYGSR